MTKNLPTIKLKGKDYVQVKDRVLYFNETYENGSIETQVNTKEDGSYAWFTAVITPDVSNPTRKFIARSAGPVDEEKSYEKLETVAVGRALALMGIGVLDGIASADETQVYEQRKAKAIQREVAPNQKTLKPCDKCGGQFLLKNGAKGQFYGCSGYKTGCKRTLSLEDGEMWLQQPITPGKIAEVFSDGSPLPSEF